MGLFDFFKKSNLKSKNGNSRNQLDFYTKSIPSNIKSLLYIADKRTVWNKNQYNRNGITISFQTDSDFEPSEIITTLPVKQGDETPLGYYPSYYDMTPEQRFKYLTFLTDISTPIDIGYVFVFYYGLERNLYLNKNVYESIDMIINLQKYHSNKSFLSYSNDAIIYAAMKMKDPTILYKLNLDNLKPELLFLVKGSFIGNFTAKDLIWMSKAVGFTNQRYISSHPEIFEKVLASILKVKYGKEVYELNQHAELDTKEVTRLMLANISIPEREFQYPNLLLSSKIHSDIYLLIKEAHEKTKLEVVELRKTTLKKKVSKKGSVEKKAIYIPNDGLSLKERILLAKEPTSDGFDEEIKGIELYKQGKFRESEEWLLRAVKGNFDAPALYERLGILYRKQKRFKDEVEILKIGIKNVGNSPVLTKRLAKAIELNEKDKLKNRTK